MDRGVTLVCGREDLNDGLAKMYSEVFSNMCSLPDLKKNANEAL